MLGSGASGAPFGAVDVDGGAVTAGAFPAGAAAGPWPGSVVPTDGEAAGDAGSGTGFEVPATSVTTVRGTRRPRVSAMTPTPTHAASATATQALPGAVANRCAESHRNIFAPATQPARPMTTSASALKRAAPSPSPVTHACSVSTAYRPGKNPDRRCAQSGRLASGTATPPMMSIGRKMHCPSACTAGTVSAIIAMTRPSPIKANATSVNATKRSTGCFGSGMPRPMASASWSSAATTRSRYRAATVPATSVAVDTGVSR